MEKIQYIHIPEKARIITISDIHGELDLLKELLEKVQFSEEDYLILNGDLVEKGRNSKGVLRYVMELQKQYPDVYVTEGNCEAIIDELLKENPKLLNYLHNRSNTLYNEWLEELNFIKGEGTTIQEIKELLTTHYAEEISWLSNLPTVIETDEYIFVHAGLEDKPNWKETGRERALTFPAFMEHAHQADQCVVVGHWPVINYAEYTPTHNPIVDKEKKVIGMDGGNVIKPSGQLNACLITKSEEGDLITFTSVDHLDRVQVHVDFEGDPNMIRGIHYPHYEVEPIRKGEHFTLCKQLDSNQTVYVKNEYIIENENGGFTSKSDVSCSQINVQKGDEVSVIDNNCTGYTLVKKNGNMGWIEKGIIG